MTAGLGEPVSDTELAARFQRDPEMFTVVYDRYARDIFRYVGGRLGVQAADGGSAWPGQPTPGRLAGRGSRRRRRDGSSGGALKREHARRSPR
jgi:hypothetical protein